MTHSYGRRTLRLFFFGLALWCCLAPLSERAFADDDPWQYFPNPPDTRVVVVATSISMNGLPQSIKTFMSELTVQEIISFYQLEWAKTGKYPPLLSETSEEKVISLLLDTTLMTVQVHEEPKGGSGGFFSLLFLETMDKEIPRPGADFPKLAASVVVNDMLSYDGPKVGRTLVIYNDSPIEENVRFYHSQLRFEGWKSQSDQIKKDDNSRILVFMRQRKKMTMIIAKKIDKTSIVVNITGQ